MNKNITEVLVLNQTTGDDTGIYRFVKETFGDKTIITKIRSPRYYDTPFGVANLAVQHKNKKNILVLANKRSIDESALENAAKTGIPFGVAFDDNSGRWGGFIIGSEQIQNTNPTAKKATVNA